MKLKEVCLHTRTHTGCTNAEIAFQELLRNEIRIVKMSERQVRLIFNKCFRILKAYKEKWNWDMTDNRIAGWMVYRFVYNVLMAPFQYGTTRAITGQVSYSELTPKEHLDNLIKILRRRKYII